MSDEVEKELEQLKRQNIVSEETAMIYLSQIRKTLNTEADARATEEKESN